LHSKTKHVLPFSALVGVEQALRRGSGKFLEVSTCRRGTPYLAIRPRRGDNPAPPARINLGPDLPAAKPIRESVPELT
jgi:hypothetical protein